MPVEFAIKDSNGDYISIGTRQNAGVNPEAKGYVLDLKDNVTGVTIADIYDKYALAEDGLFINSIYRQTQIKGKKYWQGLESGWIAENKDLPKITFTLGRKVDTKTEENVATLEITSDLWSKLKKDGYYCYQFDYLGKNSIAVDGSGNVFEADGSLMI